MKKPMDELWIYGDRIIFRIPPSFPAQWVTSKNTGLRCKKGRHSANWDFCAKCSVEQTVVTFFGAVCMQHVNQFAMGRWSICFLCCLDHEERRQLLWSLPRVATAITSARQPSENWKTTLENSWDFYDFLCPSQLELRVFQAKLMYDAGFAPTALAGRKSRTGVEYTWETTTGP